MQAGNQSEKGRYIIGILYIVLMLENLLAIPEETVKE